MQWVREMLKQRMLLAQSDYLVVDMWSSRSMRSYIGITSHIVVNSVLESQMVACKRFRGSHNAENIHEMFEETIAPYDLSQHGDGVFPARYGDPRSSRLG